MVRDPTGPDAGVTDKRLLVAEPEFVSVLKQTQREINTLSPVLRSACDGRPPALLTRTTPARATGEHISIIGHLTATELRRHATTVELANGSSTGSASRSSVAREAQPLTSPSAKRNGAVNERPDRGERNEPRSRQPPRSEATPFERFNVRASSFAHAIVRDPSSPSKAAPSPPISVAFNNLLVEVWVRVAVPVRRGQPAITGIPHPWLVSSRPGRHCWQMRRASRALVGVVA